MNKQIEKLAEELGLVHEFMTPGERNDALKKYEVIAIATVRGCIEEIETHRIPVGNSAAGEMACEWTYDALKEIRDNIKERFGVDQ